MEEDVVVMLSEFGRVGKVKYPGVGKNTHSVFESFFSFRCAFLIQTLQSDAESGGYQFIIGVLIQIQMLRHQRREYRRS